MVTFSDYVKKENGRYSPEIESQPEDPFFKGHSSFWGREVLVLSLYIHCESKNCIVGYGLLMMMLCSCERAKWKLCFLCLYTELQGIAYCAGSAKVSVYILTMSTLKSSCG